LITFDYHSISPIESAQQNAMVIYGLAEIDPSIVGLWNNDFGV